MTLKEKVDRYQISEDTARLVRDTKILLVASIVGGGKNTVVNEMIKTGDYHMIISHTTRQPRENHGVLEQNGVDYFFVSLEEAEKLLDQKAFVEAKYVHGNIYATSVNELEVAKRENKIAATDIDIHGVREYLDIKPDVHAVFLLPPSVETWLSRLKRRYGDLEEHKEEINKRFRTAYDEIRHIQEDKRFVLVINDDLDTTVERIKGVVDGTIQRTSDYADTVTEHLLDFLKTRI